MPHQSLAHAARAAILDHHDALATALVDRLGSSVPDRPAEPVTAMPHREACDHLKFLAQALALENVAMWIDYVGWAKVRLLYGQGSEPALAAQLEALALVLREQLPTELGAMAVSYVESAQSALPRLPDELPSFMGHDKRLSLVAHQYFEALLRGDRHLASQLVLGTVEQGTPVKDIYLQVFQPAQYEIGRLWQTNQISVAKEHFCTAATQLIMSQLYPHIFSSAKNGRTLIASCVSGDLHEIGVRMVADFFEMEGWDTFYLGGNTPLASIIETLIERRADVLAISATLSHHVEAVRALIEAVRHHPEVGPVIILVGGFPFNRDPELYRKVGADGSANNAQTAIEMADHLLSGAPA